MTTFTAIIATNNGQIADDSTVAIVDQTGKFVAYDDIPDRTDVGGRLAQARINAAIGNLGYRPVGGDYYGCLRTFENHVEITVEPLP